MNIKFNTFLLVFIFALVSVADAQLRENLGNNNEYSGIVTQEQSSSNSLMDMLNMSMSHSYSMTFSNFGGQTQNLNAYTNHMHFDVSDNMNAMLDVSVLHSPFGNSFMTNENMGAQIIIDRARIDYNLSSNSKISFEFSQRPYYSPYGMSPFGRGYNSNFDRRNSWY